MFKKLKNESGNRLTVTFPSALAQLILSAVIISLIAGFVFASSAQKRQVSANDFPGGDLGAKINAADKSLGAAAA
jgi:hypothetical protein